MFQPGISQGSCVKGKIRSICPKDYNYQRSTRSGSRTRTQREKQSHPRVEREMSNVGNIHPPRASTLCDQRGPGAPNTCLQERKGQANKPSRPKLNLRVRRNRVRPSVSSRSPRSRGPKNNLCFCGLDESLWAYLNKGGLSSSFEVTPSRNLPPKQKESQ